MDQIEGFAIASHFLLVTVAQMFFAEDDGADAGRFDLDLLPAGDRSKKFWVGSRDIDTKNVGFKTDQVPGGFEFDTSLPGNSNSGHDSPAYGGGKMTEDQRWDLIEYLKSL